jgi:hypothetical protein
MLRSLCIGGRQSENVSAAEIQAAVIAASPDPA